MTAAMHHLFERRPLAGAVGVGLVVHVGVVVGALLVLRATAEPPELEMVEVIPVDDERVRNVAADIERAAVVVGPSVPATQPGPRPRQFRYIAGHYLRYHFKVEPRELEKSLSSLPIQTNFSWPAVAGLTMLAQTFGWEPYDHA